MSYYPGELDEDGYPTEETLERIKNWDYKDPMGLYEFINPLWAYYDPIIDDEHRLYMSTAGWRGNEDIIYAMNKNIMWWQLYWYSSKRGGHFVFDLSRAVK